MKKYPQIIPATSCYVQIHLLVYWSSGPGLKPTGGRIFSVVTSSFVQIHQLVLAPVAK